MGRKKDAERRKRREQRMAERMQQTQSNQHLQSGAGTQYVNDKGINPHASSLETNLSTNTAADYNDLENITNVENNDQSANIDETAHKSNLFAEDLNVAQEMNTEGTIFGAVLLSDFCAPCKLNLGPKIDVYVRKRQIYFVLIDRCFSQFSYGSAVAK